jgi:P pilus assembly chaperone PapD
MRVTTIGLAIAAAIAGAAPAYAQIAVLPETSRSEAQSGAINRSLEVQGRSRLQTQQNQFEINSLRNEGARTAAPVVVAPPIAGPAPVR